MDGGWEDRDMKDSACWEIPAGNYVDEVETRHGFYFWRRKLEFWEREEWRQFHSMFLWSLKSRATVTFSSLSQRKSLTNPHAHTYILIFVSVNLKVVLSWQSCLRTDCRWNGRRLMDLFRATRFEWDPSQVRLPCTCPSVEINHLSIYNK